mmetsp:Transcript_7692/g.21404  ORF Transcript_7692/g.21404 Transcript_7692/m.21404 type:complete len:958 (+) Transcript_7692:402-3275(+)|eukprot:CAMPEP_0168730988 /NCGR_PEP_ID=MMETSP0724-20121128/7018_1 /TAXON_ID=265536 /ORGANISM="Amphiprora sp., Strain CCMP467" /LENGTH=957 /DNA_ID=CAMNT_0008777951 /DNA_START=290 /DNA_END=3163 /DNA_ORIENTATION=+
MLLLSLTLLLPFLDGIKAQTQGVVGFALINAVTDAEIGPLTQGQTLDLNQLPTSSLSIRADVSGAWGSVKFDLDGNQGVQTENVAPYALGGDSSGDYKAVAALANIGSHTVTATPYSGSGGSGSPGTSLTVVFTVAQLEGTPSPTVSTQPSLAPVPIPSVDTDVEPYQYSLQGIVNGEEKKWHKITLGFAGPATGETATPNPFTDYRLDMEFTHHATGVTYTVPGYYAADGNAANSGSTSGSCWLAHFAPDDTGIWTWTAYFTAGTNVAQNGGGSSAGYFDRMGGVLNVMESDKSGRDFRGKGRLQYVGEHHLQFAETGEWFLKAGADAPENLLAYDDFDNTPDNGGRRKSWSSHVQDYQSGDPTWAQGKGKGLIGAINYLANKGMNVFSFLPMNINGDDKNVFPYISDSAGDDRLRIDVSKTAQWEVLFEHADHIGMYLHFKTQETENDQLLDGGALGLERKLYYRELIARFGFHLALNWNLGEENTNTDTQRKAFADFFKVTDPYKHPVVVHTYPNSKNSVYTPLLGYPTMDGASLQSAKSQVFSDTLNWVTKSADVGRKWVVANDEQGSANSGVVPDADDPNHDVVRQDVLWGNIMAGGAGVEYYFGYSYACSDLTCEDFRSRANMWDQSRYALEFFETNNIPFWEMSNSNNLLANGGSPNWCLSTADKSTVVVYLKNGDTDTIDLSNSNVFLSSQSYSVSWFDPRNGGDLLAGSVATVVASEDQDLGDAPNEATEDWVVFLTTQGVPTATPSQKPSLRPSLSPSASPSGLPTLSAQPSLRGNPTNAPTATPTSSPTTAPTTTPTSSPSHNPTKAPTTDNPTVSPETPSPVSAPTEGVVSFRIWNAGSDVIAVNEVVDAASYSISSTLGSNFLNVEAVTSGSTPVGSVMLSSVQFNSRTEKVAPYCLFGDNPSTGNIYGNNFSAGTTYTVSAIAKTSSGGTIGSWMSISFTIVN